MLPLKVLKNRNFHLSFPRLPHLTKMSLVTKYSYSRSTAIPILTSKINLSQSAWLCYKITSLGQKWQQNLLCLVVVNDVTNETDVRTTALNGSLAYLILSFDPISSRVTLSHTHLTNWGDRNETCIALSRSIA